MARAFAASLGAIAMAMVLFRGMLAGQAAVDCIPSGLIALLVLAPLGWVAGAIMEYLLSQDLEQQYRRKLDWFRKETEAIFDGTSTEDRESS